MTKPTTTPKGKYLFGTVKVGEKGQIVIPKEAREVFNIRPGDSLVVLGDERQGLAVMRSEDFLMKLDGVLGGAPEIKECDE